MTTTTVDNQVLAASSGGTSTPVKLTLQSGTMSVAIQMAVQATTPSIAPSVNHETRRREFTLFWAFSPDDLTLADVPSLLMGCAKSQAMVLQSGYKAAGQRIQVKDKVNGQYLYCWFGYGTSLDGYTVTLKTTELFFLSDPVNPTFTSVTSTSWFRAENGSAVTPSYSYTNETGTGWFINADSNLRLSIAGTESMRFTAGGQIVGFGGGKIQMNTSGAVALTAAGTNQSITLTPSGTGAVVISSAGGTTINAIDAVIATADLANLQVRNSQGISQLTIDGSGNTRVRNTSAAKAIIFELSTERARFAPTSGNLLLGGLTADSTGVLQLPVATTSAGGITFGADTNFFRDGSGALSINQNGSTTRLRLLNNSGASINWSMTNTNECRLQSDGGSVTFYPNNILALTLDASQNATFVGAVTVGSGNGITWASRGGFAAAADGVIRMINAAGTDFTRLQFGGTTASFPSLARSTTALYVRLADDSGYATLRAIFTGTAGGVGLTQASTTTLGKSITVENGLITAFA